jgi:hypothetical protein
MNALSVSSEGISRGFARLEGAARRLASADATSNLPASAVDLVSAKTEVRANTAVLRATDRLLGSLLDVLA